MNVYKDYVLTGSRQAIKDFADALLSAVPRAGKRRPTATTPSKASIMCSRGRGTPTARAPA